VIVDYEAVKKFFADKLAADFAGQGRFESAFYHTIKMVHDSVSAESAARIALLQADVRTLCAALAATSEGNAKLLAENAEQKQALDAANFERTDMETLTITNEQADEMVDKLRTAFGVVTTDDLMSVMVDRFLSWQLPKDFCPDAGISFKPTKPDGYGTHWWPVGTNLFTAEQAKAMVRHMLKAGSTTDD
jgi:hypothetical protein